MSQKMIPKRIPKAYSIWLIPNGEKYILLKNTIIDLSHIFNGIASTNQSEFNLANPA